MLRLRALALSFILCDRFCIFKLTIEIVMDYVVGEPLTQNINTDLIDTRAPAVTQNE